MPARSTRSGGLVVGTVGTAGSVMVVLTMPGETSRAVVVVGATMVEGASVVVGSSATDVVVTTDSPFEPAATDCGRASRFVTANTTPVTVVAATRIARARRRLRP